MAAHNGLACQQKKLKFTLQGLLSQASALSQAYKDPGHLILLIRSSGFLYAWLEADARLGSP